MPLAPVPVDDLTAADWLTRAVTEFGGRVDELMPGGYDRYLRIFHRPDQGLPSPGTVTSWAGQAARHGTELHPQAQWRALCGGGPVNENPLEGSLDPMTLPVLVEHLAASTGTPQRVHLALWHGCGDSPPSWRERPTFALPARRYWLFAPTPVSEVIAHAVEFEVAGLEELSRRPGGLPGLMTLGRPKTPEDSVRWVLGMREAGLLRSPSWWWPEDRAWVVHSEIDSDSTLVGCDADLAVRLLRDPRVECLTVRPHHSLLANADRVNDSGLP